MKKVVMRIYGFLGAWLEQIRAGFEIVIDAAYRARDFIMILSLTAICCESYCAQNGYRALLLIDIILVLFCLAIRRMYTLYKHDKHEKSKPKRRFVFLDDNGNPTIKVEDLPEIIDYLHILEEGENEGRIH